MARARKLPLTIGLIAALAVATPVLADSATVTVFSGFFAQGSGVVTATTGNGSDTPPMDLPIYIGASVQLGDPLGLGIAPDATGDFSLDQSDGLILVNVHNAGYPNGYPISGWSFQGGTVDFSLAHGLVTNFHIHAPAFGNSHADVYSDAFSVHFDTGFQIYDFSGPWSIERIQSNTLTAVVPEPSQWALLLIGFGLTGMAIRKRRRGVERGLHGRLGRARGVILGPRNFSE